MSGNKTGGCICGAIRYRTRGALSDIVACHCSQCRRQTGLYYAATNTPVADVAIEGEDNLVWYKASPTAGRGFCRHCGSALFWKSDDAQDISIMAGSFDGATGLSIGRHIYCADKGDYYEITDGAQKFAQSDR